MQTIVASATSSTMVLALCQFYNAHTSPTCYDSTRQSNVLSMAVTLLEDWLLLKTLQQDFIAGLEAFLLNSCRLTCVCMA